MDVMVWFYEHWDIIGQLMGKCDESDDDDDSDHEDEDAQEMEASTVMANHFTCTNCETFVALEDLI